MWIIRIFAPPAKRRKTENSNALRLKLSPLRILSDLDDEGSIGVMGLGIKQLPRTIY